MIEPRMGDQSRCTLDLDSEESMLPAISPVLSVMKKSVLMAFIDKLHIKRLRDTIEANYAQQNERIF